MKNLFIIVFLFSINFCFSQTEQKTENSQTGRVEVYLVPTSYLNFLAPRVRIGAQYYANPKYVYSLDLAYGQTGLAFYDMEYNAFEIRPAFKLTTPIMEKHFMYYVGLEMLYQQTNKKFYNHYYVAENGVDMYAKEVDNTKNKYSLSVINGAKIIAANRITFDAFLGVGVAVIVVDYFNQKNAHIAEDVESILGFGTFSLDGVSIEGVNYNLSVTLGLKIGVFINK